MERNIEQLYTKLIPYDLALRVKEAGFDWVVRDLSFAVVFDWIYNKYGHFVVVEPSLAHYGKYTALACRCMNDGGTFEVQAQKDGEWVYADNWTDAAVAGIETVLDLLKPKDGHGDK